MKTQVNITVNALESARFDVRFARLSLFGEDLSGLKDALKEADSQQIDVISTRIETGSILTANALEDHGFRLMDTLVYYRRSLPRLSSALVNQPQATFHVLSSSEACASEEIARRAFQGYIGHYHSDPRLDQQAATEVYADWIGRALRSPSPRQIAIGCARGGKLSGFLLGFGDESGSSEITLNAVDPVAQRAGLYQGMLRYYLTLAAARGDRSVRISTQIQNYAVQRAWSNEGLFLCHSFYTLHRWAPHFWR